MGSARAELPVVFLLGPTAVGKTEVAVRLAPLLDAEVVGADSRQVFRHMDVGTAKPTPAERALAPHHLIDVVDPDQPFDAGTFRDLAVAAIDGVRARGRVPLVVGGSGFYVQALLGGLPDVPAPDPAVRAGVRAELAERGSEELHAELARVDPVAAARIHPRDAMRVARAHEVLVQTGRPLSSFRPQPAALGRVVRIVLDRPNDEMDRRVAARTAAMWEAGFAGEVRALAARGFGPELKSMEALGYRETAEHLAGRASADETVARIALVTRRFVRKQRAWFRAAPDERALHPDDDAPEVERRARAGS